MANRPCAVVFAGLLLLFLAVVPAGAEERPGQHQSGILWQLALKACAGKILPKDNNLAEVTGLRLHYFSENSKPDSLSISDEYCPEQSRLSKAPDVLFLVGHNIVDRDASVFYKTSAQRGAILDVWICWHQFECTPIDPAGTEGGQKTFDKYIVWDFERTMKRVIESWGH
jgi:hypothetical protein